MTRPEQVAAILTATPKTAEQVAAELDSAEQAWTISIASGVLSRMHRQGRAARLSERVEGKAAYVDPAQVNGRETVEAHSRALTTPHTAPAPMMVPEQMVAVFAHALQAAAASLTPQTDESALREAAMVNESLRRALDEAQDAASMVPELEAQRDEALDRAARAEAAIEQARTDAYNKAHEDAMKNPDGRVLARLIRAAAEKQWNPQAKVALLDLADEVKG